MIWIGSQIQREREILTEAEQLEAGQKLYDLVNETMFAFADKVRVSDDQLFKARRAELSFESPSGKITVFSTRRHKDDTVTYEVIFQSDDHYVRYHTGDYTGGKALRLEQDYRKHPLPAGVIRSLDHRSSLGDFYKYLADVNNYLENVKLEKVMGLNDIPVGVSDIEYIEQLLKSDDLKVVDLDVNSQRF